MTFKCSKNPFLANRLNLKKIPKKDYAFVNSKNETVLLSNHEILQNLLTYAPKSYLLQIQQVLTQNKFDDSSIESLVKLYAKDMLVK